MEWTTVISLILVGLLLLIIEVIFIPGTTIIGIAGFIVVAVGVFLGFKYFGSDIGWAIFGGTAIVSGGLFYLAFKTNAWSRFALKTSIDSKVNEVELDHFKVGMEGKAVSALRPVGKAEIGNKIIEVVTLGEFVDTNTPIRIIKVLTNKITVEPIN